MTTNIIAQNNNNPFDSIRHFDEHGSEFWYARELMPLLDYVRWDRVPDVVERSMISCKNAGNVVSDHFSEETRKTQGRPQQDYKLSRYACYLVAMNGDPRKEAIGKAQTYFALKAREAELTQVEPIDTLDFLIMSLQEMKKNKIEVERFNRELMLQNNRTDELEYKLKLQTEINKQLEQKLALEAERTNQIQELVNQHDAEIERYHKPCGDYYSVLGYAKLKGLNAISLNMAKNLGKQASKICRDMGLPIEQMSDPRFGKVNCYPEMILEQII